MIHRHFPTTMRLAAVCVLALSCASKANAQSSLFGFNNNVVGGVSVDAEGMLRDVSVEDHAELLKQLRESVHAPTGRLADTTPLRMISLSKLQSTIAQALANHQALPDEVLYLAGLQRVEYVFAYPEQGDIVIAGPAEPWTVRKDGSVVGKASGRPVLRLEDLLVALRTSDATRDGVISVSIDPTPEGQVRLQQLLAQIKTGNGFDPAAAEPAMKEAFGPQQVTFTTVPTNSRMAQILVAADYEMKRIAMHLQPSPVKGLPSFMEMVRNTGARQNVHPRWWMATHYDAILHSEDRLAWKITGLGVTTMTEDSMFTSNGQRVQTGKSNQVAQQWADQFTSKFDQLCTVNAVFGDLRNVIDLNIVATIINSQQLQDAAGCNLSLLCGANSSQLETPEWRVPQQLDPHCSFVRGRAGWTVSASGGVEINPWKIVSQSAELDDSIQTIRNEAKTVSTSDSNTAWWWN